MTDSLGLIEEGAAFRKLDSAPRAPERFDVIVIGGGQAGLSVGYHLKRRGIRFLILDANARVGDSWRQRWDSLRLFTPARFDSLDGLRFPAPAGYFPTKDEMADYLESYARHFELPVRNGIRVDRVTRHGAAYRIEAGASVFEATHVVIAMASYQAPRVPDCARELDPRIHQVHSSAYRGPGELAPGPVLIAGAGNSGAEIAADIARTSSRKIVLAGRNNGEAPVNLASFWGRLVFGPLLLRVFFHRVLTIKTRAGRKFREKALRQGGPLIRTKATDLARLSVERCARVAKVVDGKPCLDDGRVLDVANVIWCTGFSQPLAWLDLPIFDAEQRPIHDGGVVINEPGAYFVGMQFVYAMSSTMIHGVGRDAKRISGVIAERLIAGALARSEAA
ncbi:MAG: NAD(P)-binding domain-containing protein [Polyangiaceae bacterium]